MDNLSKNDLETMVVLIDACSSRGAFKGEELFVVGQLRGRIRMVIEAYSQATETSSEQAENNSDEKDENNSEV